MSKYCGKCGFEVEMIEELPTIPGVGPCCPKCGFGGQFLDTPPKK